MYKRRESQRDPSCKVSATEENIYLFLHSFFFKINVITIYILINKLLLFKIYNLKYLLLIKMTYTNTKYHRQLKLDDKKNLGALHCIFAIKFSD